MWRPSWVGVLVLLLVATAAQGSDLRRVTAVALGWRDRKDVHVPVVITRPPSLGHTLSRWFREQPTPVSCRVDLLSPYAIDVTCTHRSRSTRDFVWLERGFPPVELSELGLDLAVFDSGCPVDCRFDVEDFAIDTAGVTFLPANGCICADLPTVPLDELDGRAPRARRLIAWLAARGEAGAGAIQWTLDE